MSEIRTLIDDIRELPRSLAPLREEILANLVMLAQIPSPTGQEAERVRYVLDRFTECGLPHAGTDESGNAVGFLPGITGEKDIMLVAHLDTLVPDTVDHNVTVQADRILGAGISDNALGAAVMSGLPALLDQLGIRLHANLQLIGSVQSLNHSNQQGLKFHLDHGLRSVDFGICVEGINLGRLNFFSIGTLRGDIACHVRPKFSRSYGSESAIVVLNQVINKMLEIATPQRPYTRVSIGKVHAGMSYDVEPEHAELGFEVISHSDKMIDSIQRQLEEIVSEMSARHAVDATLDCFFRRQAGGLPFSHPLVKSVVEVMEALDIEPDQGHSPSELSEFIRRGIPAVTLGISTGERSHKQSEYVDIDPILRGVAQLIGVLLVLDSGVHDES